ncbi:Broad-Complex, Tramtrack and Bric a brac, partial [Rhizoctonia solani]
MQPLFKPPSGGDLTLRSNDGIEFVVHSTILKIASSVFSDMFTASTVKDTVQLTENASDVSYLLRFIYPNRLPVTISLDELPICLLITQKYDVGGALEVIDELVAMDGSPHKPLSSDPIRTYQLAVQFNLTKTKSAVAPLVTAAIGKTNFCDLSKLQEYVHTYPSLKLIRMMNLQAMRSKALFDILFHFKSRPMLPEDVDFFYDLSCGKCWPQSRHDDVTKGHLRCPTTWALSWARLVYDTLLVSSIDTSQSLFESTILQKLTNDDSVCRQCLSRLENSESYRLRFEAWARGVKRSLETQLERLELLYTI